MYIPVDSSESQTFLNFVRKDLCHCDDAFDYWGKGTSVTVTSAVQGPPQSLFNVWQCGSSSDGFVTLACVTRDLVSADGLSFTWKDPSGSALTDVVQYPSVRANAGFTSVSHARVKASDWDQNKNFTCEVNNGIGTKEAKLQKPVVRQLHASLLLTAPTQTELQNGTATFICLATQFSPKSHSFTWTRESKDLGKNVKATILSQDKGLYTAISVLEISANDWTGSSSAVNCTFQQKEWTDHEVASPVSIDTKQPEVRIIPPSTKDILISRTSELRCVTEKDKGFKSIKWLDASGRQVTSEKKTEGSTVTLMTLISFEEWSNGTKFTCEVENSAFTKQFKTEVYQRGNSRRECPKVYLLPPPESSGDSVTLTCYVKGFYPEEVAVSWLVDDKQVDSVSGYEQKTTSVIERDNLFSMYSQLIFSKTEWESGTVFSCRVYHESIEDPVRLISRSITIDLNPPTLVDLTLNVPSTCPLSTY